MLIGGRHVRIRNNICVFEHLYRTHIHLFEVKRAKRLFEVCIGCLRDMKQHSAHTY